MKTDSCHQHLAFPAGVRKKPEEEFPDLYDKDVPEPGPPDLVEPDEDQEDEDGETVSLDMQPLRRTS